MVAFSIVSGQRSAGHRRPLAQMVSSLDDKSFETTQRRWAAAVFWLANGRTYHVPRPPLPSVNLDWQQFPPSRRRHFPSMGTGCPCPTRLQVSCPPARVHIRLVMPESTNLRPCPCPPIQTNPVNLAHQFICSPICRQGCRSRPALTPAVSPLAFSSDGCLPPRGTCIPALVSTSPSSVHPFMSTCLPVSVSVSSSLDEPSRPSPPVYLT